MPPVSYAVQNETTSPKWALTFARGCGGISIPADRTTELRLGDAAFFGSPEIWGLITTAMQDQTRDTFYGDHAYFRRRQYYRITRNRLQHDGLPTPGLTYEHQRARECGVDQIRPWQKDGTHIVICPNSPRYMALFGIDAYQWIADVMRELSQYTARPTIVRWKTQSQRRPLAMDLVDAWAVVVFSSNAAVEGLMGGIPCVTLADFAASRRMGRTTLAEIEQPLYPEDREMFLTVLAHNQWTFKEMEQGDAWRVLRRDH